MDTILLILGILGFGAIVISIYVFTVAARNYVSDTHENENQDDTSAEENFIERSSTDRRENFRFDFPMTVSGMLIPMERRITLDRRCAPG